MLNGRPGYASATTRERVLEVARELGYRPNALARGLVTSRTGTLGVVITDITRGFFTQVVGSIEQVASQQGYSVLLACADGIQPEQTALETFLDKRVDGIICMSSTVEASAEHILQVTRLGVPLVVINRPLHTSELNQIAWDDVEIGQRATEHLIGLGHRRIAHLSGPLLPPGRRSAVDRHRPATSKRSTRLGLPVDPVADRDGGFDYQIAFAACGAPVRSAQSTDGRLRSQRLDGRCDRQRAPPARPARPDDVSVVGANDDQFARPR